jgi:predicted membrane protein
MATIRIDQGRLFSGLLIILIGILFFVGVTGNRDVGDVFGIYWPLIFIFMGLWILIARNFRNIGFGVVLMAIGSYFLLNNLDILGRRPWHYFWPILIILFGLSIIFHPGLRRARKKAPAIKEDDLDAFAIFSGMNKRIETKEFRGGKATAMFGGIDLDLTRASLAGNEATVELAAIFGGLEIKVPEQWELIVDSNPVFGGIEDKRKSASAAEDSPKLYVKATAIFGGIDIKS